MEHASDRFDRQVCSRVAEHLAHARFGYAHPTRKVAIAQTFAIHDLLHLGLGKQDERGLGRLRGIGVGIALADAVGIFWFHHSAPLEWL